MLVMLQPYVIPPIVIAPSQGWRLVVTAVNSGSTLKLGNLTVRDDNANIIPGTYNTSTSSVVSGSTGVLQDVSITSFLELSLPATISLYRPIGQTIDIKDMILSAGAADGIPLNYTLEQANDTTDGTDGTWTVVRTDDASQLPLLMNQIEDIGVISTDEQIRLIRNTTTNVGVTTNTSGGFPGSLGRSVGKYVFEFFAFSSGSGYGGIMNNPLEQNISVGAAGQVVGINGNSSFFDDGVATSSKTTFFIQDFCMVVVDLDNKRFEMIQNNISLGFFTYSMTGKMFPLAGFAFNNALNAVNFGATAFTNTIPTGYKSWDENQEG